jgi:hypothetical protein
MSCNLMRFVAALFIVTLGLPAFAQCTKDTDCKADRVCTNGSCAAPSSSESPAIAEAAWKPDEVVRQFEKGGATRALAEAERAGLMELAARLRQFSEQYLAANDDAKAMRAAAAIKGYEAALETSRSVSSSATNKYSRTIQQKLAELWSQSGDVSAREGRDEEARAAWAKSKFFAPHVADDNSAETEPDQGQPADHRYTKLRLLSEKERLVATLPGLGLPIFGIALGSVGVITFSILAASGAIVFGVLLGVSAAVLLVSTAVLAVLLGERGRLQHRINEINSQLLMRANVKQSDGPLATLLVLRL